MSEQGWFWPTGARRAHYDGGDGRSLCGTWSRLGFFGNNAPFLATQDGAGADDCASCSRRLAERTEKAS